MHNQISKNGSTLTSSCDTIGRLLNSLNISLITETRGMDLTRRKLAILLITRVGQENYII